MIKIFLTILAVYLLYYTGNMVYDLFLKKDDAIKEDDAEEYALAAFADSNPNEIKTVSIDDVEHLNTPGSFTAKELFSSINEEPTEPHNLDHWRRKFESEQDIDAFEIPEIDDNSKETEKIPKHPLAAQKTIQSAEKGEFTAPKSNAENVQSEHKKEDTALKIRQQFNQFLSLAETQVQVLSDREGFKVYHSMI